MLRKIKHHWIKAESIDRQNQPGAPPYMPSVKLIGAPDDRGVLNVGGRLGAGHGPEAIRRMLSQFMLGIDGAVGRVELFEGYDVPLGDAIQAGHAGMRRSVCAELREGRIPVVLGGGHDYGYPHAGGAADALNGKIALINVDAHLDVRPPGPEGITSGSPFYLALEEGIVRPDRFVELGIQEHCNDEAFMGYLKKRKVRVISLEEARSGAGVAALLAKLIASFARKNLKTVVSFDLDAVQMAHAPGVSAPQSDGFTPGELLAMARVCGESPDVATIGFFELAPPLDEGQKTARLAATALHRFVSGVSRRGGPKGRRLAVGKLLRRGMKRRS
jgi:formimidoylglutamase